MSFAFLYLLDHSSIGTVALVELLLCNIQFHSRSTPTSGFDVNSQQMKSSVFQYPYEKVLRRARGAATKLGLKITNFDSQKGSFTLVTNFSFSRPTVKIDLVVEEIENHNTKVSVSGSQIKRHFFQKNNDAEMREAELLDAITAVI